MTHHHIVTCPASRGDALDETRARILPDRHGESTCAGLAVDPIDEALDRVSALLPADLGGLDYSGAILLGIKGHLLDDRYEIPAGALRAIEYCLEYCEAQEPDMGPYLVLSDDDAENFYSTWAPWLDGIPAYPAPSIILDAMAAEGLVRAVKLGVRCFVGVTLIMLAAHALAWQSDDL